jgi:hypothetical protein
LPCNSGAVHSLFMDWLFFYQVGVAVTLAISIFTLFQLELTERERWELGVMLFFGTLVIWPGILFGLVAINIQAWENRA